MRFGIAGTGRTVSIADSHTRGILADGRGSVAAVFNRNVSTSERWTEKNGVRARVCADYEELLSLCDAVIICTPNATHFEYASAAIKAGKHVLCEKPMSVGLQEAYKLAKLAEGSPVVCRVGLVYRFSAGVNALKTLVRERIGRVYSIDARMGGSRLADPGLPMEWRMYRALSGSGALGDFGSHLLDIAAYACETRFDAAAAVTATSIKQRRAGDVRVPVETDDVAALICSGAGGVGCLSMSRVGMDKTELLVVGEGGMARLELGRTAELTFYAKEPQGGYTGAIEAIPLAQEDVFEAGFRRQISDFIDAAEHRPSVGADFADGLYIERLLDIARCAEPKAAGNNMEVQI